MQCLTAMRAEFLTRAIMRRPALDLWCQILPKFFAFSLIFLPLLTRTGIADYPFIYAGLRLFQSGALTTQHIKRVMI